MAGQIKESKTLSDQAFEDLKSDVDILTIEPDFQVETQSDIIPWGIDDINATEVQEQGISGEGINVAVFDTGVSTHNDLNIVGGISCIDSTTSYSDDNGHGTHVAGTISALANGSGIIGTAPTANLYSVKVLDANGIGSYSDIIEGIEWAIDNNINIINMSFGGMFYSSALEDAINLAYQNDILIFAAAGNYGGTDDSVAFPARLDSVIAVGAVDKNNTRASFSSVGAQLELMAPGVDIESTAIDGTYRSLSGSSMASPHAAGVAALLWSKNKSLSNTEVRATLDSAAKYLGYENQYGFGLVDAKNSIDSMGKVQINENILIKNVDKLKAKIKKSKSTKKIIPSFEAMDTGALSYAGATNNSISINATFPISGVWGNHLAYYDYSKSQWFDFIDQNSYTTPYRTNGIHTVNNLTYNTPYIFFMSWWDYGNSQWEDLPLLYCRTLNNLCPRCWNPISTTQTVSGHTPSGHTVTTYCAYCSYIIESVIKPISSCLSCTTAPSISFNNITGATILKETDTSFPVQIKVLDNENDFLTCNYYLNRSNVSSGTNTATNTSSWSYLTFTNTINAGNLYEGAHTIKATARDSISPTGETSITFKVDKSNPIISSVAVAPTTSGVKLTASAYDAVAGLSGNAYQFTVGGISTSWLTTNYYDFASLVPNTVYNYTVNVMDMVGHIATYSGTFSTLVDKPIITTKALDENKVQIVIKDNNPSSTYYKVYVSGSYATSNGLISGASENWFTIPYDAVAEGKLIIAYPLPSNSSVSIIVTAKNSSTSAISESIVASVLSSPGMPSDLTCTEKSYNYIRLGWKSVAGATSYQLYRETLSSNGTVIGGKTLADTTLLSTQDYGVIANQDYRYKIRAKNSAGIYGCWSSFFSVKTLPNIPEKVTGIKANTEGKTVNLTWDAIPNALGYKIYFDCDRTITIYSANTNQKSIDTGKYDCQCIVMIRAYNYCSTGNPSNPANWSNGGALSDSVICYTKANMPILNIPAQDKITPNSITLSWQANNNPASVTYKIGIFKEGLLVKEISSLDKLEYDITGMTPELTYNFKIKAKSGTTSYETNWSNEVSASTLMDYPGIPGGLIAVAYSDKVSLTWDPAYKAQKYQIDRDDVVIATIQAENETDKINYVDTTVEPETKYTYKVCAINTTTTSDWSQPLVKRTKGSLPSTPTIASVSGSSISISIIWTPVSGATGYEIQADGMIYNTGLDTTYIHNGLIPGSNHSYSVRARNNNGNSSWSEIYSIKTLQNTPDIPSDICITTSSTQIDISWSAVYEANNYEVEIDGLVYSDIVNTEYRHTVQGAIPGSEHSIRIRAINSSGQSDWSVVTYAVLLNEGNLPIVELPQVPVVTCVSGAAMIFINWEAVEGATVYKLEADNTVIYTGSGTSFSHTGLSAESTHQYRVSAGNISGYSDWSNPVTEISGKISTNTPNYITYYRVDDAHTVVTWSEAADASGYRIEINGAVSDTIIKENKFIISTQPGTQYDIRIGAIIQNDNNVLVNWSDEVAFISAISIPVIPSIISISTYSTSISLSWSSVTNANGYEVFIDENIINVNQNTSYIFTGLKPSTNYMIRVRAYNKTGVSSWTKATTTITLPYYSGVPTGIIWYPDTVSSATGSSIKIRWNPVNGSTSYDVEVSDGNMYSFYPNDNTSPYSVTLKNLVPGTSYNFRIRGKSSTTTYPWSSWITLKADLATPTNVKNVQANRIMKISWNLVNGANLYEIEIDGIIVATTSSNAINLDYATFFKQRTIRIRACYGNFKSDWSQPIISNQPIDIIVNVTAGEEFSVLLPVNSAEIGKCKLTLTFNTSELELVDAFGMTPQLELSSTLINQYDTNIIIEQGTGLVNISFIIEPGDNMYWSSVASNILFRSKMTGTVTLKYGVTDK